MGRLHFPSTQTLQRERGREMAEISEILGNLVIANRILDHENVVDGFGHISVRHLDKPERFFLARSRSPGLIEREDLLEFGPDGEPVIDNPPALYSERYIHAAVYEARPDVHSVIHSHAEEVIPFGVTGVPLRPVYQTAVRMGATVPVWDIADRFGDTDLMVRNLEQARDLAAALADNRVVLMRGHGATIATSSVQTAVMAGIYTKGNARIQAAAMQMGKVNYLSPGELGQKKDMLVRDAGNEDRNWEYYSRRAGFDAT